MKFKTVAEAFNHYRTATLEEIERRASEIKRIIETDANADVAGLNIEIAGLQQAKENLQQRQQLSHQEERRGLDPITGMSFERRGAETIQSDVFASTEYRSAFFKSLLGQQLTSVETAAFQRAQAEQRADAFSSVTNSVAVLPTATLNEVISKARTMGGLMSVCRGFNMPSKITVPVGTPSAKANWHTEGTQVASEAPSVASVAFGRLRDPEGVQHQCGR